LGEDNESKVEEGCYELMPSVMQWGMILLIELVQLKACSRTTNHQNKA